MHLTRTMNLLLTFSEHLSALPCDLLCADSPEKLFSSQNFLLSHINLLEGICSCARRLGSDDFRPIGKMFRFDFIKVTLEQKNNVIHRLNMFTMEQRRVILFVIIFTCNNVGFRFLFPVILLNPWQ